jgi:hypothetical protein
MGTAGKGTYLAHKYSHTALDFIKILLDLFTDMIDSV